MKNSKNYVVTLGRQFGCGAREIGQMVAQMLGIGYYDKEILLEAAKSSGVEPAIFEASDERTPKFFSSLWSFNLGYYSGTLFAGDQPVKEDNVYHTQSEVMIELAQKGPCVIVGRTADYILREEPNLIKLFIHAPYKYRIRFLCKERGITADEADDLIVKNDRERSRFYDFFTDKTWGQADSYDLCVDVTKLGGEEKTAQFLADYVRRRMERFE